MRRYISGIEHAKHAGDEVDAKSVAALRAKAAELRRLAAVAQTDEDREELVRLAGRYTEIADQMTEVQSGDQS
jgi:hypothetical protein